jgi:hypothetical protein
MPITLALPSEPMTRDAVGGPGQVIQGRAYRQLRSDLLRYCRGEVTGRSFVVSGHRGAGKTTLLLALVEDLRAASKVGVGAATGRRVRRPFMVSVSAPDVYERPTDPKKADLQPGDRLLQHLSRQMHFAAADEFARAYRARASAVRAGVRPRPELLAAAGQLGIELRAGARLDAIRRFWGLARAFDHGVLFAEPWEDQPADQGVRELVALDASAEAYQIAIGKVASEREIGAKSDTPAAVNWSETLKSGIGPVGAVLGSVAGATLVANSSFTTTLAASGAGLLLALGLTSSVTQKISAARSDKSRFEPDTTIGSLAWRVPATIDLFFNAGLAPVFVVDELDKRVPE